MTLLARLREALLALAGVAHVLDLWRRWQPRAHQAG